MGDRQDGFCKRSFLEEYRDDDEIEASSQVRDNLATRSTESAMESGEQATPRNSPAHIRTSFSATELNRQRAIRYSNFRPPPTKQQSDKQQLGDQLLLPIWKNRRYQLIAILIFIFIFVLGLLVFFLCPRSPSVVILNVDSDQMQDRALSVFDGKVGFDMSSTISAKILNSNFHRITIEEGSIVQVFWVYLDGKGPDQSFGQGVIDSSIAIPKRSESLLQIPIKLQYTANPATDPLYVDFMRRCMNPQHNFIQIRYQFQPTVKTIYGKRKPTIRAKRRIPCPMTQDEILQLLQGMNLKPEVQK